MTSDPSDALSARCRWGPCCCVCCLRTASDVSVTPAPASGAAGSPFAEGSLTGPEDDGGALLLSASEGGLPDGSAESTALAVASTARCDMRRQAAWRQTGSEQLMSTCTAGVP